MKLGVCAQAFFHLPIEAALKQAAALGIQAMELPVHRASPFADLEAAVADGGAGLLRRFKGAGLEISALSNHAEGQLLLGPHGIDTDPMFEGDAAAKAAYARRRLALTAELAQAMGVGIVCGFTGCEDYSRWFPWPLEDGYERMVPAFRERMMPVLDDFQHRGVRFAIECHPRQFAYNLDTARLALEAVDHHPALAFNFDPGNLMLAGVDPVAFIAEMGERIVHVHAKDAELVAHHAARSGLQAHGAWGRPGRGFRFRVPGWGDLQWRRILTELQVTGYRGVIAIEHEDPTFAPIEGIEQAVRHLEPLLFRDPAPARPWW